MAQQLRVVSRSPHLNVMCNAAFKAARGLVRDFGEVENLQISRKGPGDFVSIADKKAEDILYQELKKARPTYGFIMEESGTVQGEDEHTWIIDPLNGTTNFLHGFPHFAISIGLQKGKDLIAGVIYDPIKDEMFFGEKGGGAFLNDKRLRVSNRHHLADALLATGLPSLGDPVEKRMQFQQASQKVSTVVADIRLLGSAALNLAYVAAGRFEGYWEYGVQPWDLAAGIVLVREAGGYVCDLNDGQNFFETKTILATNQAINKSLKETLLPAYK